MNTSRLSFPKQLVLFTNIEKQYFSELKIWKSVFVMSLNRGPGQYILEAMVLLGL